MRFDHLVLLVRDLDKVTTDFEKLGFVVLERNDTSHGPTRFRFVSFNDGAYILLTAFSSDEARAAHRLGPVLAAGEGWADYSFLVDDARATGRSLKAAGIPVAGPVEVANTVAGGHKWALDLLMAGRGTEGDVALPFLVSDRQGARHRVPGPSTHANGANGVAGVKVASAEPAGVVAGLLAMGGKRTAGGPTDRRDTRVGVSNGWVDIVAGDALSSRPEGGLFEVHLSCDRPDLPPEGELLDIDLTHGAAIRLMPSDRREAIAEKHGSREP